MRPCPFDVQHSPLAIVMWMVYFTDYIRYPQERRHQNLLIGRNMYLVFTFTHGHCVGRARSGTVIRNSKTAKGKTEIKADDLQDKGRQVHSPSLAPGYLQVRHMDCLLEWPWLVGSSGWPTAYNSTPLDSAWLDAALLCILAQSTTSREEHGTTCAAYCNFCFFPPFFQSRAFSQPDMKKKAISHAVSISPQPKSKQKGALYTVD